MADTVTMENFQAQDVTTRARVLYERASPGRRQAFWVAHAARLVTDSLNPSRGQHLVKWKVRDIDTLVFGMDDIDLSAVAQIAETGQLQAIAAAMIMPSSNTDGQRTQRRS